MFRLELEPEEMAWFDQLFENVKGSRRALTRRPQADFERPIFLLILLEAFSLHAEIRRDVGDAKEHLRRTLHALEGAGIAHDRRPVRSASDLNRVGQTRLEQVGGRSA